MPEIYVSPIDRPDMALSNLLLGNVGGAARSLAAPDSLSPDERKKLVERFGITNPGPFKTLLETATNPTVIVGAILTARYDVPGLRSYMNWTNGYGPEGLRRLMPYIDGMASFGEIFNGTPIPSLMYGLSGRIHESGMAGTEMLAQAAAKYTVPTKKSLAAGDVTDLRLGMKRLTDSGQLQKSLKIYSGMIRPHNAQAADKLARLAENLPAVELTAEERATSEGLDAYAKWDWERRGAHHTEGISQAMRRKGQYRRAGTDEAGVPKFVKDRVSKVTPGGEITSNYLPLITKHNDQTAREVERVYSQAVLAGGQKQAGLKILGAAGTSLRPSEHLQLMKDYAAATGANPANTDEFIKGFNQFIREWAEDQKGGATTRIVSGSHYQRMGHMLPDPGDLRKMGGQYAQIADTIENYERFALNSIPAKMDQRLELLTTIRPKHKIGAFDAFRHHNFTRARDEGWTVRPEGSKYSYGERIAQETRALNSGTFIDETGEIAKNLTKGADPVRAAYMTDTFIPAMMGNDTYKESLAIAKWNGLRVATSDKLALDAPLGNMLERAGAGNLRKALQESIANSPRLGYKAFMGEMASYMYVTTLGAPNLIAPIKNLFQTIITTYPTIGLKHTMKGMHATVEGINSYIQDRFISKTLDHEQAFVKAFPGFVETGFSMDDALLQALDKTQEAAYRGAGSVADKIAKLKKGMLSLFSTTELFNRLVAHHGHQSAATEAVVSMAKNGTPLYDALTNTEHVLPKNPAEALKSPVAQRFLQDITSRGIGRTQFGGGPLNTPAFLVETAAPLRQLTQFPLRYLNLLLRSGPGFIGRVMLGTGLAIGAAKLIGGESGEKLASDATMFGALPEPVEGSPGYPIPLIPPILQLGLSGVQSLVEADTTQLRRSAALLVPGGVGFSRMLPVLQGEASGRILNKPFVAWDKGQNGHYPMYTPEGNLIGYYTKMQLFAKSLGLGDVTNLQEQALSKWLLKYGERMQMMSRDYVNATGENDQRTADTISEQYQRMHPGLGPMPIRPSQMRALHLRKDVSRIERQLDTLPPEVRADFTAAISMGLTNVGPEFLGLGPGGLASGQTVGARDPYRLRPPPRRNATSSRSGSSGTGGLNGTGENPLPGSPLAEAERTTKQLTGY